MRLLSDHQRMRALIRHGGGVTCNVAYIWFGSIKLTYTSGPVDTQMGDCVPVHNRPPRSTQPGYPFVGRRNEYQPKVCGALRLGSKGRNGSYVGMQVKLCDPHCYTRTISERYKDVAYLRLTYAIR